MNNKETIFGMTGTQLLVMGTCAVIGVASTVEYAGKFVERRRVKQAAAYMRAQEEARLAEENENRVRDAEDAARRADEAARRARKQAEEAERRRRETENAVRAKTSEKSLAMRNALRGRFKREAAELAVTVSQLDARLKAVDADLVEYKARLSSYVVPSRVQVTNVYRYCSSHVATNVTEKVLTAHERKVKGMLMAFNDRGLEKIYTKYMPGETFAFIKSELVTEYRAIIESHEEFGRQKTMRRRATTGRINALNAMSSSEMAKKKNELETDLRTIAEYKHTSSDSPLHDIRMRKAKAVERKYNVDSWMRAEDIITARLKAFEDTRVLSPRFQIVDVVRNEANADLDAESEERFKQDKTACIQRGYDKISHDVVVMLETKKAELAYQMEAAVKRAEALTGLLDNWDLLDEERLDEMAKDMQKKILDAVAGVK